MSTALGKHSIRARSIVAATGQQSDIGAGASQGSGEMDSPPEDWTTVEQLAFQRWFEEGFQKLMDYLAKWASFEEWQKHGL